MAVVLRFARTGTVKKTSYRIVAADKARPRDGRFLEVVGHYNPKSKVCVADKERVAYWLGKGAKASDTVGRVLAKSGIV